MRGFGNSGNFVSGVAGFDPSVTSRGATSFSPVVIVVVLFDVKDAPDTPFSGLSDPNESIESNPGIADSGDDCTPCVDDDDDDLPT
jgi:hypothetical protein